MDGHPHAVNYLILRKISVIEDEVVGGGGHINISKGGLEFPLEVTL